MIILFLAVALCGYGLWAYKWFTYREAGAAQPPVSDARRLPGRRVRAPVALDDQPTPSAWTALDEHQLRRLLNQGDQTP